MIHPSAGGNLQDVDAEVLPDDVWEALLWVYTETGHHIKHSLGLNLPVGACFQAVKSYVNPAVFVSHSLSSLPSVQTRNTTLAALQLQNAKRFLPADAVATIIIGNEPDSYM
jgi:hypothetical protein